MKSNINYNSQVPSVITRKRVARPCLSRLRRVNRMCSRTVSDTANRLRKTRKKKSSAVPLISERSHIGNLRQIKKQGKGRSSKRKENRRLSFLFAPAAGAATSRRPQTANPPAEVQRKTPRPSGTNTLTQFAHPGQPVQEKEPPVRANPPAAVRAPRLAGAGKGTARQGEPACGSSRAPAFRCRKRSRPSGRTRLRQFVRPAGSVQKNFSKGY